MGSIRFSVLDFVPESYIADRDATSNYMSWIFFLLSKYVLFLKEVLPIQKASSSYACQKFGAQMPSGHLSGVDFSLLIIVCFSYIALPKRKCSVSGFHKISNCLPF